MLTIRLTRKGKKNQPFFRVVLVDKRRSSTGGRSIEDLGYVDPLKKRRSLKGDRIKYWLSKGAKTSVTIHNLLVTEKIIDEPKIKVSNISKKKQAEIAKAKTDAEAAKKAVEAKPVESVVIASEAKQSPVPAELPPAEVQKDLPPAPAEEPKPETPVA
jgi:small subunit ribosomal protein S16